MQATAPSNAQGRNFYGSRYVYGRDVKDIAKDIRADIRESVKAGALPAAPVTYSVRIERFSGGQAIRVRAKGFTEPVREWDDSLRGSYDGGYRHTSLAATTIAALEGIVRRYHQDNSDSQVDYFSVNFYYSVAVDGPTAVRG